jgi:hypothetical protein
VADALSPTQPLVLCDTHTADPCGTGGEAERLAAVRQVANGEYIELDLLLLIAISAWEKEQNCNRELFASIFTAADINRDGVLSFEEFRTILKQIEPGLTHHEHFMLFQKATTRSSPGESGESEGALAAQDDTIAVETFCNVLLEEGLTAEHYTRTAMAKSRSLQ